MSDRPIAVGDLVIIIKPTVCCQSDRGVGLIYRVSVVETGFATCDACGYVHPHEEMRAFADNNSGALCSRLKRIPGLGELTKISVKEKIRVPVHN